MDVKLIRENPDGSADFNFDMTPEEVNALMCFAIITALKNAIEEGKRYEPSEFNLGNTTSGGASSLHGSGEQSSE
jgi:hypothetical protein